MKTNPKNTLMLRLDRPSAFPKWTYKQDGHSLIERGNRIRPERHNRKNIQKITWQMDDWMKEYSEDEGRHVNTLRLADTSANMAIRRILSLYENQQYREVANFINQLNYGTFKAILGDLPIEIFVNNMPLTLVILEALYARVFLADGQEIPIKLLRPENVVMQMAKIFAMKPDELHSTNLKLDTQHAVVASCKKLLKIIVLSEPQMKKIISRRKRFLDKSIRGLGLHGMVGASGDTLMNLHDALKLEFERVIHRYKCALQKLDELSLTPKQPVPKSISRGPAPIKASHQRQLSLRQEEIQERLIQNKTLLNVIEPTLNNYAMNALLTILQKRIETDKDALLQFNQLRKEIKDMNPNSVVASILMALSQGCCQILEFMKEFGDDDQEEDDTSTDISGYHSDSDSAIGMSGCSNVGSTTSRSFKYNLPQRSSGSRVMSTLDRRGVTESPTSSSHFSTQSLTSSLSNNSWRTSALQRELQALKSELAQSRLSIEYLQDKELKMKQRMAEQSRILLEQGGRFENAFLGERRTAALIRRYGNLYAQSRVDTLDALDSIIELEHAHDLKLKILFSSIVLSFRSVCNTLAEVRTRVRQLLHVSEDSRQDPAVRNLELCITNYMKSNADRFDLRKNIEDVLSQIWATLYDYPALKKCEGLKEYVKDCVRHAWCLSNQQPPFVIEYETRTFRRDLHVRFHSSDQESYRIKTYLWPTLLEGRQGPCVHKGVVIT